MPSFTSYNNRFHAHNQEAVPSYTNKNVLNPLAEEQEESFNNNNHNNVVTTTYNNTNTMAQLRATSAHLSMENSPQAHEYNPNCKCGDCQYLLQNFTNYSTLDDYTAMHLKYEAEQCAQFSGRVPCVDGFYGEYAYAPVPVATDSTTGEAIMETRYVQVTSTYLFHSHLHHMNATTPEVRNRSLDRYYSHKNVAPAPTPLKVPAPRHQHNNKKPSYVSNNNTNNHAVPSYYNATTVAAPAYNTTTTSTGALPHYSQNDIQQARRDVAFCGVASLG